MHDQLVTNSIHAISDKYKEVVQHTNMFPAGVAVLCIEGLEAGAAVRPALLHDVSLSPQHSFTFEAAEVLHVPVAPLCLGALIRENDLRKERLGRISFISGPQR